MRAFLFDGTQCYAALFMGDTYYKQQKPAFAAMVCASDWHRSQQRNWVSISGDGLLRARTKVSPNWLKLKDGVSVGDKDGKTNITVDSSLSSSLSAAWLAYGLNRALWMNQKFKKEFPKGRPTGTRSR
jgi:hypothetical protein